MAEGNVPSADEVASGRGRISIEQRAARGAAARAGGDRYGSLLEQLRAGTAGERARTSSGGWARWHPVARKLLVFAAIGAVVYVAVLFGSMELRANTVHTWAGPDATVQSGERLASCPQITLPIEDIYPAWIRYDGAVYARVEAVRVIGTRTAVGETPLTETGYELDGARLLLDDRTPAGRARDAIYVLRPPAAAARTYERVDGCT